MSIIMSPDPIDDPTPCDSGDNPINPFDPNASGGSGGDYYARGDYGSARYGSDRGSIERRELTNEGDRSGSVEMAPRVDHEAEGPYGSFRGFYSGKSCGSMERSFDQGRERSYGKMGRSPCGSPPGRFGYGGGHDGHRMNFPGRYDCGRRPYGYGPSRGGHRGDHMRSGHAGGYGRGYGYSGRYGSGYGSRMARYGYSGNERGYRGSNYSRGQGGYGRYGDYGRYGRDMGRYGRGSRHADSVSGSVNKYAQGYGSPRSFDPSRYKSGYGLEGRRQGSDYYGGYFGRSSYPGRSGYSSDNYRYGGSRHGYGQGYGGYRSPPDYNAKHRFGGHSRHTGYGGHPGNRGGRYPYGPEADRYRNRYGSYPGQGPDFRRSHQYGSYSGDPSGTPPSFPPFSQSRPHHPTSLEFYDDEEQFRKLRLSRAKEMAVRANSDLQRRKFHENPTDSAQNPDYAISPFRRRPPFFPVDNLRIEYVDFLPKENSKDHRTFSYELVQNLKPSSVFRRGQSFFMEIAFKNRDFNPNRDCLFLNFYNGPNPSVPKKTRVVLPVVMQKEFQKVPQQWDVRVHSQDPGKMTLQVHIPSTTAIGCWHCVVETTFKNFTRLRLPFRAPMNMYIIFNPFCPDDATFLENDDFRTEYVMNDNGKIFMGGFKSAKGRPWVYGQFDDCVLPAACVLLEMSKLAHSEWGNPAKVVRAISAMIKAAKSGTGDSPHLGKSNGMMVPKYEEDFRGGSSPHLWTGSVQIIEEFLKGGASPVKYGHCWIMAALMTTFCRALGLASRPVTAFVAALNTQDSMTVDKYINRYGDPLECGPGRDQPDSLWAFHTWSEVWMMRSDLPAGNSGWQACDPSRVGRSTQERFSASCGPCSLEAIRKGDIGFQKDTDIFYSLLNAYVRYYYECEQSEWGFLPFMQFRFPVARYILTKAPNCSDDAGDEDFEDVTVLYKNLDLPEEERFAIYNAYRGRSRSAAEFDLQALSSTYGPMPMVEEGAEPDVNFDFKEPVRTLLGEPLNLTLLIKNNSESLRTIQANISCRSIFYTGVMGPRVKRVTGHFTLEAGRMETLGLRIDPVEYQDKLIDMSFVKITVTGFVREKTQSFVNEFDFRFDKPKLLIQMPEECPEGKECPFELTFMNPLGMTLSECFVTFEVNGAARPETIQIEREVGPREAFCFSHTFIARRQGLRHLVACFSSKQLSDINGMRKIHITE